MKAGRSNLGDDIYIYKDIKGGRFARADWESKCLWIQKYLVNEFRNNENGFIDNSKSSTKITGITRNLFEGK